jgi:hypothetical protein
VIESITYAPVYIPTLNRFEHFKRCLDSLEHCTGADKTDVYVGLDFPPSNNYVEGWKRIDDYLAEKEINHGFKTLNVRRRDHNLGIGHAGSNGALLLQEVMKVSDCFIVTEDDNEFSKNFLVFINKALNKFKNDDRVYCVCGYNRRVVIPDSFSGNYYLANDYVAWGVGFWVNKQRPVKYRSFDYLKQVLRDNELYTKLKEKSPGSIRSIMAMLKLHRFNGDALVNVYEALEDKYSIMPTISKVRNHGNDGSGLHSKKFDSSFSKYFSEQPIDEDNDFEFSNNAAPIQPEGLQFVSPDRILPFGIKMIKSLIFQIDLFLVRYFGVIPRNKII